MSKQGNIVVRDNSGANTGTRRRLNFIDGANVTITTVDDSAGDEVDVTIASAAAGGTVLANRNGGAPVGVGRPELSFIEGANITLTVVDDGANNEIDITIASAGAGGGAWLKGFYPAVDPDSSIGTYNTVLMPDENVTVVRQNFMCPDDIVSLTTAVIIVIPEGTGDLRRSVSTNFAAICVNEVYNTHTDSIAVGQVAVTLNEVECIDVSAALTGIVGGDLVGLEFTRDAVDALDTVNADVHYVGVYLEGTT